MARSVCGGGGIITGATLPSTAVGGSCCTASWRPPHPQRSVPDPPSRHLFYTVQPGQQPPRGGESKKLAETAAATGRQGRTHSLPALKVSCSPDPHRSSFNQNRPSLCLRTSRAPGIPILSAGAPAASGSPVAWCRSPPRWREGPPSESGEWIPGGLAPTSWGGLRASPRTGCGYIPSPP